MSSKIRLNSSEQAQEVAKQYLRNQLRDSLLVLSHYLGYREINPKTHGKIINCLEDQTKRKLIVCPRGAFKSTLGVVCFSIWNIIRNPDIRILVDSELYTNSKNFIREIKFHLESEQLTSLFGQFKTDYNWSEGSISVAQRKVQRKESTVTASGVGAVKVGQHYDLIICDDLNSQKNSGTQDLRQKVIDHWRMNIALLEPGGSMIIIGTRYSAGDLIQFVLDSFIYEQARGLIGDENK